MLAYPRGLTWAWLLVGLGCEVPFPAFALSLFCKICIAEEGYRTWTSSDGRKIQAKFIEMVGKDTVKIKIIGGREFELEKDKISEVD